MINCCWTENRRLPTIDTEFKNDWSSILLGYGAVDFGLLENRRRRTIDTAVNGPDLGFFDDNVQGFPDTS